MARPCKAENDPTKKLPVGVSLTRAERQKFNALGGSKWLAAMLAQYPANPPPPLPGAYRMPDGSFVTGGSQ